MSQTLRQLRAPQYPRRRGMTFAGKCWLGYFAVVGMLIVWVAS